MEVDPNILTLAITAFRNLLGGLRDAKEMLPESKAKQEIAAKIEEVDSKRIEAEIKLAQAWGYPICRRTFPPEVMLKEGDDPETGGERFRCPKCGDVYPRPFPKMDYSSPLNGY